jgi:hypothetical protein
MKKYIFFLALIFIFFTVSLSFAAPIGKITQVQGRVDVLKTGKNMAAPVSLGAPVDIGDIYRAKTNSRAEITFINKNILRIAPATKIEIKEYMAEGNRSSAVMRLHRGRVQAISGEEFIKRVAAFAEGNKFEVHTPNAVAGIRGSNMLVGFNQGTTVVIFIGGHGYLYNPQSPQVFIPIATGQMSFVTGEGTPSQPVKASEAFISGGGEAFIEIKEIKTIEGTGTNGVGSFLINEGCVGPGCYYTPPPGTNFTGTMEFFGENGTFTGNIPYSGNGTMSASGTYTGTPPTELEGWLEGTSDKGGAFRGPLAGIQGSWLTRFSALYVEGGNIYFLTGDAPGTYDGTTFSLSGTLGKTATGGTITLTPGEGQTLLDVLNYAIYDSNAPQFFPSDKPFIISNSGIEITPSDFLPVAPSLITNEGRKVAAIANIYTGDYADVTGPPLLTSLPYLGYIGAYEYALGPLFYSHDTTNQRFTIDALLQSIGIDYGSEAGPGIGPYLGVYSMRYLGTYDSEERSFRMAGAGTFVATPANFFGDWGIESLYYNDSGVFTHAGYDSGYFGGTSAPWTSPASFIAMGEYYLPYYPDLAHQPHYLMNTYISGSTTQEVSGGVIEGFAGAIWKDGNPESLGTTVGSIDGAIRALYISTGDTVTAGIMKSNFTGSYYPFSTDSGMWGISGTLTPTPSPYATGLDPGDISYGNGYIYGTLSGTFDTGSIYGEDDGNSQTAFLYTSTQSLPFGIFNIRFGNSNPDYSNPTGNTSWSATLGGSGTFGKFPNGEGWSSEDGYWLASVASASGTWTGSGEIRGNLTGKALTPLRLYDMEGRFYGVTDGSPNSWIGQAIGSYTGTPLKFSSAFSTDTSGQVKLYRAQPGTYYEGGYMKEVSDPESMTYDYYDYEFDYVKSNETGMGIGKKSDGYLDTKNDYFPDGTRYYKYGDEKNSYIIRYTSWDIGSIEEVKNLPSGFWSSADPDRYSKWPSEWPIYVLEQRPLLDTFAGILGSTGYPWAGGASVTIIGKYTASDYIKPTIFTTQLSGKFYSTSVEDGITNTNGAYEGVMGGFLADDARGVQIGMRGLYIGPDNNTAGVFRGSYAGSLYKDIGMWDAAGTLVATVMNSNFLSNQPVGVNVTKDNLDASGNIVYGNIGSEIMGRFTSGGSPVSGSIIGTMVNSGTTRSIKGQDWGVLNSTIWLGGYGVPSSTLYSTWSAKVVTMGQFGQYQDTSGGWHYDTGGAGMSINGTFTDGVVRASHTGDVGWFMTMTKRGTISDAGVLGIYTPGAVTPNTLYSWQGVIGGVWKTTEYLTFPSSFGGSPERFGVHNSASYNLSDASHNYSYYYDTDTNSGDFTITWVDGGVTKTTKRNYRPDEGPFSSKTWGEFTYNTTTKVIDEASYKSGTYTTLNDDVFTALAVAKGYDAVASTSWSGFNEKGSISAIIGGVGDLWSATSASPATVYFGGDYNWWYGEPSIFGTDIVSINVKDNTKPYTTLDGMEKGAYKGYIGGREIDGAIEGEGDIEGRIYAIYIKGETSPYTAGILKGTFTGTAYQDIEQWEGTGSMYPIRIATNVSTLPESLNGSVYQNSFDSDSSGNVVSFTLKGSTEPETTMGGTANPFVYEGQYMALYTYSYDTSSNVGWGVWNSKIGGVYTGISMGNSWSASIEFIDSTRTRIIGQEATGTLWSGNKIEGTTRGYGADISPTTPVTWVSVGEVMGTFNPSLKTFQVGSMGVSIETTTFLALAADTAGQAKLTQLGIPCVEVGMTNLTGSGTYNTMGYDGTMSVTMNNTKFFAATSGGPAKIWATGQSQMGSWSHTSDAVPTTGTTASLSGGPLSATFTVKQFDSSKWLATINGTGGYGTPASTTFKGAAAGTVNTGAKTFSGTAAGHAK